MEIKRSVFNKLYNDLSVRQITILVGPRQVGKTFLLRELDRRFQKKGLKTAFFDLEQPSDLARFNEPDAQIIEWLSKAGDVIFIDEFHYLKNASKIFKALYDREARVKIYASGSSALEIHTHLKESLAGRKFVYHIFPCSLEEMEQAVPKETFCYYCIYGGMPGTIHFSSEEMKKQLLADILQSYLLKDIKALIREENLRAFNHLLYLLAQFQGNIVSVESLGKEVGLTAHTISSYLDIMGQTYVNFPIYSYSRNYGNELKKSKKYYLFDIGIRNTLLKNFAPLEEREDAGPIVESYVFSQLQRQLSPETEIRFWRLKGGEEVDFVWIKNRQAYPIEVKLKWKGGEIPSGLKSYLRRYPKTKKAFVVSGQSGEQITFEAIPVQFKSFQEAGSIPKEIG
ncbi:MAG: ATP-binding protein [Deltaproteobacteria bacterium]|nr:ATP-binding protein [Deltaproteobacteria bacterium]MBI4223431.1 ATP-binding protein [Deltaproteobacteria bacterium]